MKPSINHPSSKSSFHTQEASAISAGASVDSILVLFYGSAFGGDALGRLPEGKAVFVPYAIESKVIKIYEFNDLYDFLRIFS